MSLLVALVSWQLYMLEVAVRLQCLQVCRSLFRQRFCFFQGWFARNRSLQASFFLGVVFQEPFLVAEGLKDKNVAKVLPTAAHELHFQLIVEQGLSFTVDLPRSSTLQLPTSSASARTGVEQR